MMNIPTISEMDIVHIRPPDFEENWGGGNYAYRREWIMGIYARPTTGAAAPTTVHFCLIPFQTEMVGGGGRLHICCLSVAICTAGFSGEH
jgi:hypothetical protein